MVTIPEGFAQASFIFVGEALPYGAVCTLGLDVQGYAGSPDQAAQDVYERFAGVGQDLSGSIRTIECRVKFGPTEDGPSGSFSGETIGVSGGSLGPNSAHLITKSTALGGRRGKGRMFLPGVGEANVDNGGNLSPAIISALSGSLGDFFAGLITDGLPPVLLHEGVLAPTPVLNFNVESRIATQRKRLRR